MRSLYVVYFCTPVKIGFSTSWIGFWPGGEPGMVLVKPWHGELETRSMNGIGCARTYEFLKHALV